ncbi:helix-turn-helix domain-containing protein [Micromonospora sp. C95]|uniref:helix-turn-helix domain-containing protein n=1 Tax=Micromonospora sp. C95 TaxID=2824882 RepID=UPI001B38E170|nr:helix-turn-helix domain-containing protein [Micromonospora sp. C95]MBQ1024858.1 helix-turn-helix transcriptional regulator [Micromonospora sp. C95]
MTGGGRQELPIGRRIAQLRVRRGMSQQVFADRIGRSKSWVDKIERGARRLDRLSVIETVAGALGVATGVLVGRDSRQPTVSEMTAAVERVREALARYDLPTSCATTVDLDRQVGYALAAYRHAQYPQLLRILPDLLADARHAATTDLPVSAVDVLVRVYRLAAQVLVKLGEPDLAWLTADRAMTAAGGDPRRTAIAVVGLAQALRAVRRGRLALAVTRTALHALGPTPSPASPPEDVALAGVLLVEAALASATCGDATTAGTLTDQAARLARLSGHGAGFGPVAVDLARALTAANLGDNGLAIATHKLAVNTDAWHRLPAEHRAGHLIDITRTHLALGDPQAAGRALVVADRIAPAETRVRPAGRAALTAVLRAGNSPADVTRLATLVGLTRQP